ncbi:CtpA-like serine protease [Thermoclostridium stercorarium subsp. stercorarium DSM 8532]|uniref:CtpA-like serine protease n=1 Tax=Thermoclostridium stercorarium (strain ATCC 35414 / DSM 8532 / NCIMB 11754) TaxID=1121335 RepID=L7VN74_THES1|nr:S41 family peptidase [Thermoclostridium stercorarium]AGC68197.1 CtpA-like serine protease [Thermoclostridium stercorarium subsp. stercorarium DSM 8532]AGI39225.1 peptidase [Thermoclostridium stercorarium subsp. stercorarium DSM 8532]
MKKIEKFCVCFLSFIIVLSYILVLPVNAAGEYSDYLDSVMNMVLERYYRDVTREKLLEGALKGIFGGLDDYTVFYDMEEAESFFTSMEGNYQGIGVEIMQTSEGALITRVFDNSPAESAGLLPDDIIVTVNGQDVKGLSTQDIANLIKGEKGTIVEIGVIRGSSDEIIYFSVERNVVNLSPVEWKIYDDVMYIKLESFSSNSAHYFGQALKEADSRGIKKLVLDLRNNPGGEVSQAVNIAKFLVSKGIITTLDFKSEEYQDVVYRSHLEKPKYVTAVLVNGNTASASEILAGAIQDSGDGFLVGTKTFGKGVFQNVYPILNPEAYEKYKSLCGESIVDGYEWMNKYNIRVMQSDIIGWVKITTGHYLTRNGRMIDGVGLIPDFAVEDYSLIEGIDINSIKELGSDRTIELNGVGNDVYSCEKILKIKGYDIDTPDNILDAKTSDALKKYQADKGIKVTGVLDGTTKNKLNEDLNNLRFTIDKPLAKAIELLKLLN